MDVIIEKFGLERESLLQRLFVIHNFTAEFETLRPYIRNLKKFYQFSAS
jgi:hypothetical protein